MSETFQCGDNAALVGYLYDECEAAERRAIEAHLARCPACAAEVAALGSTRLQLSSWAPPETELGFAIVRAQASGLRPETEARVLWPGAWWRQPLPAWAQAAAAIVLFGAGLWLGVLQGGQGQDEQPAATVAAAPPSTALGAGAAAPVSTVSAQDLAALESRLRGEIAQIRTAAAAPVAQGQPSDAAVLARVRALLDESEQRQQRELALRVTQVMRDFETQRRADLAQIQGNFRQIEGVTGAQVREQQEVMNYLRRVSQQGR
jgi:hypothetical protein